MLISWAGPHLRSKVRPCKWRVGLGLLGSRSHPALVAELKGRVPRDLGPRAGEPRPPGSGESRTGWAVGRPGGTRMTSDGLPRWSSGVCPQASPKSSWKSSCAPCPRMITSRWWLRTSGEGCGGTAVVTAGGPRSAPRRSPLPPSCRGTPTLGMGASPRQSRGALPFALPRLPRSGEKNQTASLTRSVWSVFR